MLSTMNSEHLMLGLFFQLPSRICMKNTPKICLFHSSPPSFILFFLFCENMWVWRIKRLWWVRLSIVRIKTSCRKERYVNTEGWNGVSEYRGCRWEKNSRYYKWIWQERIGEKKLKLKTNTSWQYYLEVGIKKWRTDWSGPKRCMFKFTQKSDCFILYMLNTLF